MSPNILAFTYLILVFRGMGAGVAIMLDNLDPPPPPPPPRKKRIQEGENDAFWPCGFISDFATGIGGRGCGSKIVDQTRKYMTVLQPSVTNEGCQNDFL